MSEDSLSIEQLDEFIKSESAMSAAFQKAMKDIREKEKITPQERGKYAGYARRLYDTNLRISKLRNIKELMIKKEKVNEEQLAKEFMKKRLDIDFD